MREGKRAYLSYLVRVWQSSQGGELIWRASLQSPQTGERWSFARLGELYDFLDRATAGLASNEGGDEQKPEPP